jgi:hypothetical protein
MDCLEKLVDCIGRFNKGEIDADTSREMGKQILTNEIQDTELLNFAVENISELYLVCVVSKSTTAKDSNSCEKAIDENNPIAIINHTFLNNFIAVSFQIKKLQFLKYIFLFCFVFFLINQALFVKIFKLF